MALSTTLEGTQKNFYQLLNQLDAGEIDKVNIMDGGIRLAVLTTWPIYQAADPSGSAEVDIDVVAAYSGSPAVYTAPLYRLTKKMRDKEASTQEARKATGSITAVAGANLVDGETFTITNADGDAEIFEFDLGGGVGGGNVAVVVAGGDTAAQVAIAITDAIMNVAGFGVQAIRNVAVVDLTQSDPGAGGNVALAETVLDAGFIVTGFTGGLDAGKAAGVVGLKRSKNDDDPRAALIPADHADAIGL